MRRWFRKLDISTGLQLCFMISALLCLFVGGIGLYTWSQQRGAIALAIDEDFPKVQAAFLAEEQINLLQNSFIGLINVKNINEKIEWQLKTERNLELIKKTMHELKGDIDDDLINILERQSYLLKLLSINVVTRLELGESFYKIESKINWLHDDFHNEFTALLQDISWQQSSLANAIANKPDDLNKIKLLKKIQQELLIVYGFISYEDQIVSELKLQITGKSNYSSEMFDNYLSYLKLLINDKVEQLENRSSTYTINQIMDDLISIGLDENLLPTLLDKRQQLDIEQSQLMGQIDTLLDDLRERVRMQVGNSQKQLQVLQNIVDKSTRISGFIILLSMLIAFVFVIMVNFFYIRMRLLKRFQILNSAVDRLISGDVNVKIAVYGDDELGRIAKLFRLFLFEMNRKNKLLEQRNKILLDEIKDRIKVQKELVDTQNELIQTAKLAVVGQTLTSISHEINQPLNAMSAYVYSAKRAINQYDISSAVNYLDKIENLIERTALIIKRLRQFSRKGSGVLQQVSLTTSIMNAWNLLEPQFKRNKAKLISPKQLPFVLGEDVLIQQVFVNLFLNAVEAADNLCTEITIEFSHDKNGELYLFVFDNGKGWPLTDKLLQPFSSSKSINLGLGLSISLSIMKQCDGDLFIASTLNKHALIILKFKVDQNV